MESPEDTTILPFLAGMNDDNQPVFEGIEVCLVENDPPVVRLLKSPLFTRNYAAGDKLEVIDADLAQYELLQRSGNLCIRVFCQGNITALAEFLTPAMEKLEGSLDLETDGALVYSIHVSIGFSNIEALLDKACTDHEKTVWYYGNVYDPEDGVTPLGWWTSILE